MAFGADRALPVPESVARAAGGDDVQTMDQFFARTERRAFRIAQFAIHDAEEALDVVQDAMLHLVRMYRTRPPAEWAPLFHRILQSRIRDWQRRSGVRRRWRVWLRDYNPDETDGEDPIHSFADPGARDPSDLAALGHTTAALRQAMRRLPQRQLEALLLRIWEGLDVAQTARAMGCSEGSVKTHYSRAVHALRSLLGDHWDERRI